MKSFTSIQPKFRQTILLVFLLLLSASSFASKPVPIVFHLFGSYANMTDAQLQNIVCGVAGNFNNSGNSPDFAFYLENVKRFSTYNTSCNTGNPPFIDRAACTSGQRFGAINVYLDPNAGIARYICSGGNTATLNAIVNAPDIGTLTHEIGHYFGLSERGGGSSPGCGGACNTPLSTDANDLCCNIMNSALSSPFYFSVCQRDKMIGQYPYTNTFPNTISATLSNSSALPPLVSVNNNVYTFNYLPCSYSASEIDFSYFATKCPQQPQNIYGVFSGGYYPPDCNDYDNLRITFHYTQTSSTNVMNFKRSQLGYYAVPPYVPCGCSDVPPPDASRHTLESSSLTSSLTPHFTIHLAKPGTLSYISSSKFEFAIFNSLGQVVYKGSSTEYNGDIPVEFSSGLYIFRNLSNGDLYKFVL